MSAVLRSIVAAFLLSSAALATESSDLLDDFNEVSLEIPSLAFEVWDGGGEVNSDEFKAFYFDQFDQYIQLATRLSIRAIACANGDIPQAEDYASMTDLKTLYVSIAETVTQSETKLKLWRDLNDEAALNDLGGLISKLTVAYSRMLFELSSCSGYLYGELVN